jgi:hypothetical protein
MSDAAKQQKTTNSSLYNPVPSQHAADRRAATQWRGGDRSSVSKRGRNDMRD